VRRRFRAGVIWHMMVGEAHGAVCLWREWPHDELKGEGFVPWHAVEHPQLGAVEVGGWTYKFTTQNAPTHYLREICERHAPWTYYLARTLPGLVMDEVRVEPITGQPE
jgi:hypothetical protein